MKCNEDKNRFVIETLDGCKFFHNGTIVQTQNNMKEIRLADVENWGNIAYAEYVLNKEQIPAGAGGFFVVPAGHSDCTPACENTEYSLGSYRAREDGSWIFRGTFMPLYGYCVDGMTNVIVVTGMPHDCAFAVSVKDNQYTFSLRFEINGKIPYESIKLQIHTFPSDDWADISKCYRAHQLRSGFLPMKQRLNPELQYSLEAPNVRIRMAWKPVPCQVHEQTPENEPPVHVACTFDDVIALMESYQKHGIEKAEFCLVGWNMKGHDGRWPQILPVESSIGGEAGLRKLMAKAKELGYAVTCHTNSTDAYSIADNFSFDDIALKENGEKSIQAVRWAGGRTYNVCPKRAYEISCETLPAVADLGFRGMHYVDVITMTPARECFSDKHPVNKKEACGYFDKLFAFMQELFGSAGSEGAYDHSLKNCDYTLYASFADYSKVEARHALADEPIPFWQMVYHGIVASNPYCRTVNSIISPLADDTLKVIEYGGKPQIYYYAKFVSDNTNWIGDGDFYCHTPELIEKSAVAVKKTMDIFNELSYLQYEFMAGHRRIGDNVYETRYEDGSVVTVDYNAKTYQLRKPQ